MNETPTFEEIQARIRQRVSTLKPAQSRRDCLYWDRQTATTVISCCGRFLISQQFKDTRKGREEAWTLFENQPHPKPPRKIGGPYISSHRARLAADDYLKGQPMQMDLA